MPLLVATLFFLQYPRPAHALRSDMLMARMNNTSCFQAIQYQYNTRAPVLQYNTNIIPMQY